MSSGPEQSVRKSVIARVRNSESLQGPRSIFLFFGGRGEGGGLKLMRAGGFNLKQKSLAFAV